MAGIETAKKTTKKNAAKKTTKKNAAKKTTKSLEAKLPKAPSTERQKKASNKGQKKASNKGQKKASNKGQKKASTKGQKKSTKSKTSQAVRPHGAVPKVAKIDVKKMQEEIVKKSIQETPLGNPEKPLKFEPGFKPANPIHRIREQMTFSAGKGCKVEVSPDEAKLTCNF